MEIGVKARCPRCGHENIVHADFNNDRLTECFVVNCFKDECGERFAVEVTLRPSMTIYSKQAKEA